MNQIEYSIVIPCYSSGEWLEELAERIAAVMIPIGSFELILVNDKSPDEKTWEEIVKLAQEYEFIRGIDLLYNVGQFRATLCGLEHALGKFIITMDDDLQNPPEEIPKLLQAMKENPSMDCIMGKYARKHHSLLRNAGSCFLDKIMNRLYGKPPNITTSSFRIMTSQFVSTLIHYRIASPQLGPLIVALSKKISNVTVQHEVRKYGLSGYGFYQCVKETFRSIINASIAPLRMFSFLGFATAGIAFLIALFHLFRWALGGIGLPGFTSLILTISFFSGMVLAGIGVLGEYIGRIIHEISGLPRFIISKQTCYRSMERSETSGAKSLPTSSRI